MDEYPKYYKWRKPDTKECILNDSVCRMPADSIVKKADGWLPGAKGGRKKWTGKEHKDTFRMMEISCISTLAAVS